MEDGVLVENTAEDLAAIEKRRTQEAAEDVEDLKISNRQERNDLLASSDWTQANDSPLTDEAKASWVTYRTALRNLPSHSNWPNLEDSDWPTKP
jgi:hypothetical protein